MTKQAGQNDQIFNLTLTAVGEQETSFRIDRDHENSCYTVSVARDGVVIKHNVAATNIEAFRFLRGHMYAYSEQIRHHFNMPALDDLSLPSLLGRLMAGVMANLSAAASKPQSGQDQVARTP